MAEVASRSDGPLRRSLGKTPRRSNVIQPFVRFSKSHGFPIMPCMAVCSRAPCEFGFCTMLWLTFQSCRKPDSKTIGLCHSANTSVRSTTLELEGLGIRTKSCSTTTAAARQHRSLSRLKTIMIPTQLGYNTAGRGTAQRSTIIVVTGRVLHAKNESLAWDPICRGSSHISPLVIQL